MANRILYLGPSGIGDWCFIYPSLPGIAEKYHGSRFDIIVPYPNAGNELLRHNQYVASLRYLDRKTKGIALLGYGLRWLKLLLHIRRQKYTAIAISYLSNQPDFLLLALLSGVKTRIGRVTHNTWLETKAITRPIIDPSVPNKVSIHQQYAAPDHHQASTTRRPLISQHLLADAHKITQRFAIDSPYVVLGIGGGRNAEWRFWPAEHYRTLIDLYPGLTFVLLGGGSADRQQAQTILGDDSGENIVNLVDKTTMIEAVNITAGAQAVIGNDSGIANLACVLNRPTICLYGPTNPALTGPALLGAIALHADTPCRPCFGDDQDPTTALNCAHHQCLWDIPAERVAQMLAPLIAGNPESEKPKANS